MRCCADNPATADHSRDGTGCDEPAAASSSCLTPSVRRLAGAQRVDDPREKVEVLTVETKRAGLTVTDAAVRWGFFHLGRFSADYAALFQRYPRDTLRAG